MKNKITTWVFIILFLISMIFGIVLNIKYMNLKNDFNEMQIQNNTEINRLEVENRESLDNIQTLKTELENTTKRIELLQKKERSLKKKNTIIVSNSMSESIDLLKKNLCEN